MTPAEEMIEAAKEGDTARIREMLAKNPGLAGARNDKGETAILAAAYRLRADVVKLLLAAAPELDVYEATAVGELDRVKELVEEDGGLVNSFAPDGFTPLGLAAFFGHQEIAEFLIAEGVEVNAASKNDMGVTPLHSAVAARHTPIVDLLLKHGADVNARQSGGFAPLHSAANNGQKEMIRLLLARGADINAKSHEGVTPLQLAVERDHRAVAGLLRQHGATS